GIVTSVEARLGDERLPEDIETMLYRLVQEALTNVVKHAAATTVSIVLARRDHGVNALVEDDGRGVVPEHVSTDALGLVGMRERREPAGLHVTVAAPDNCVA